MDGQLGLEATPEEYVAKMVEVFRAVRRVLADDGTLWLNLGDCYCTVPHGPKEKNAPQAKSGTQGSHGRGQGRAGAAALEGGGFANRKPLPGLKHKDLVGIPWRLAFALQADGWWLRSDIIWSKPNPMPESVRDRPTKAHEYLFLLAKSGRYYYDAAAIAEPVTGGAHPRGNGVNPKARWPSGWDAGPGHHHGREGRYRPRQNEGWSAIVKDTVLSRNRRSVWTIPTQPFPEAHFATFPEALVEPCILAGSAEGDTVLDPFAGSGTVGVVAHRLRRRFVGVELSPEYHAMALRRIGEAQRQGLLPIGAEEGA